MKLKRLLTVSGIVGAVGLLIMLTALITVGFDIEMLDLDGKYTKKSYSVSAEKITAVDLNTENMKAELRYRDDDSGEIKITYYESENSKAVIVDNNGVLTFSDKPDAGREVLNSLFGLDGIMHGIKRSRLTAVVELPKECRDLKLRIITSNGAISAEGIYADSLELTTSNASISVSGEINGDVRCATSNAGIKAGRLIADNVTLGTSNGGCDTGDVRCGSLEIITSNGQINCADVESGLVKLDTSNGRIEAGSVAAYDSFYAETHNAGIYIKSVESDKIEMYSSNGGINATVVGNDGDYAIESGTSNGNNNVYGRGNSKADKSLRIFTSNADINIDFIPFLFYHTAC